MLYYYWRVGWTASSGIRWSGARLSLARAPPVSVPDLSTPATCRELLAAERASCRGAIELVCNLFVAGNGSTCVRARASGTIDTAHTKQSILTARARAGAGQLRPLFWGSSLMSSTRRQSCVHRSSRRQPMGAEERIFRPAQPTCVVVASGCPALLFCYLPLWDCHIDTVSCFHSPFSYFPIPLERCSAAISREILLSWDRSYLYFLLESKISACESPLG